MDGDTGDLNLDMTSAMAEMDNEFGSGDASDGGTPSPSSARAPAAATPSVPAGAQPAATSAKAPGQMPPAGTPAPWMTPPKSWKRDLHEQYAGLADPLKQYVHEREKQALDGIMYYKGQFDPYDRMASQYKPFLEQAGASMPEVAENMLRAHIALTYGDDQSKAQFLGQMLQSYNLMPLLQQMFGTGGGQQQESAQGFDPNFMRQALMEYHQSQIAPMESRLAAWEKAQEAERLEVSKKEVDSFFADPQNKHAAEVGSDMISLMQNGVASNLKDAYDKACYLNPSVRAKLMQEAVEAATRSPAPAPRNVRSGQTPPASTKQDDAGQDLEATMRETLHSINNR